jgi:molecular chaperone GrpE (heat shock protein)/DNA-binding Xre family transcriptional regulator
MTFSLQQDYTQLLQQLMQRLGFSSYRQLSQGAGVSEKQLRRLRQGQASQLRGETLLKLSHALQMSVGELLTTFSSGDGLEKPLSSTVGGHSYAPLRDDNSGVDEGETASLEALRQEYQRLQQQLENQRETVRQEFQQSSLQVLESWLVQWPTAAYAAQQNQQLPAVRLLPLLRPVEQLLQEWGVEAIAAVGSELPYDPQWHQLMEGTAQPGESVKVRYTGYRLAGKLLYRAKVSPISNANKG